MKRYSPLLATLCFLALAAPAAAEESSDSGSADGSGDQVESKGSSISGSISFDQSIGIGSFVDQVGSGEFIPGLTLRLGAPIPGVDGLKTRVTLSGTLYGLSYGASPDPGEQFRLGDTLVDFSYGKLFEDETFTGIKGSASLRFYVPTSPESQTTTLIVGIGPRLGLSRSFDFLSLSAGLRYRYSAFRFDQRVIEPGDDPTGQDADQAANPRYMNTAIQAELGNLRALGGFNNTSHTLYWDMNAGFDITSKLSFSISLFVINGFAKATDATFVPTASATDQDYFQRDVTWGVVDLSYVVNDHFDLSIGTSSQQSAKRELDGQFRFPWFDFEGPAANRTSLYVTTSGSF